MESPKVSVIIPVYNAGHRLRACIDSLVNQTLKEIELIFVLDCPTDGSDTVVYEYAKLHKNIIVIKNEKNLNIGLSRNEGINVAKGKYIAFCDHDDIVKEFMYEHMYHIGEEQDADIVLGVPEYKYFNSTKNKVYYYPKEGNVKEILLPLIIGRDDSMQGWEFYFSHGVIWDNIYRREMINSFQISFIDNNKVTYEDNLFLIECLIHCNKSVVYNRLVYIHTIEDTNTAATQAYMNPYKVLAYITYLDNLLERNNLREKYHTNFINSVCSYLKDCYRNELKGNIKNIGKFKKVLDIIKDNPSSIKVLNSIKASGYVDGTKNIFTKICHNIIFQYLIK